MSRGCTREAQQSKGRCAGEDYKYFVCVCEQQKGGVRWLVVEQEGVNVDKRSHRNANVHKSGCTRRILKTPPMQATIQVTDVSFDLIAYS